MNNLDTFIILGDLNKIKELIKLGYGLSDKSTDLLFVLDDLEIFNYFKDLDLLDKSKFYIINSIDFNSLKIFKYLFKTLITDPKDVNLSFPFNDDLYSVVDYPLDSKGEIDYSKTNINYYTFLGRAVEKNSYEIVKELIDLKADVNLQYLYFNGDSSTWISTIPLGKALYNNNTEIIKLLIDSGSDLNKQVRMVNLYGYTAEATFLKIAEGKNNSEIVKYLKSKGAK